MLNRVGLAILVFAIVWVVCLFGGTLVSQVGIPIINKIGSLILALAIPIAAIFGGYQFFGRGFFGPRAS